MVPDRVVDLEDELIPDPNSFSRVQRKRAERAVARAREVADVADEEIEPVLRPGEPVDEIVTYAGVEDVDHIVIGKHRPRELRPLLRTVAEAVARNADIPVTIVP